MKFKRSLFFIMLILSVSSVFPIVGTAFSSDDVDLDLLMEESLKESKKKADREIEEENKKQEILDREIEEENKKQEILDREIEEENKKQEELRKEMEIMDKAQQYIEFMSQAVEKPELKNKFHKDPEYRKQVIEAIRYNEDNLHLWDDKGRELTEIYLKRVKLILGIQ